jgi:hypothetical protein
MGAQAMNKQSENKATQNRPKFANDELNEQELEKASGGAFDTYIVFMRKSGGTVAYGTDPNTGGGTVNPLTGK